MSSIPGNESIDARSQQGPFSWQRILERYAAEGLPAGAAFWRQTGQLAWAASDAVERLARVSLSVDSPAAGSALLQETQAAAALVTGNAAALTAAAARFAPTLAAIQIDFLHALTTTWSAVPGAFEAWAGVGTPTTPAWPAAARPYQPVEYEVVY
jgi:hypothetical protein